jgi:ABC-type nickel/cobalt efflux system permease component RcnA
MRTQKYGTNWTLPAEQSTQPQGRSRRRLQSAASTLVPHLSSSARYPSARSRTLAFMPILYLRAWMSWETASHDSSSYITTRKDGDSSSLKAQGSTAFMLTTLRRPLRSVQTLPGRQGAFPRWVTGSSFCVLENATHCVSALLYHCPRLYCLWRHSVIRNILSLSKQQTPSLTVRPCPARYVRVQDGSDGRRRFLHVIQSSLKPKKHARNDPPLVPNVYEMYRRAVESGYIYVHTHTHTHREIHTYIHTHKHTHTYTHSEGRTTLCSTLW